MLVKLRREITAQKLIIYLLLANTRQLWGSKGEGVSVVSLRLLKKRKKKSSLINQEVAEIKFMKKCKSITIKEPL